MFETASPLEGCDKAPESWMTTICQLSISIFYPPYSIFLHLMSLFLVPKLPVVYFCSFLPSVYFNFNDIPLLWLFSSVGTAFPNLRQQGGRERKREGGRGEGKDISITQKDPEVQDVMTLTVGSMINALIYI